MTRSSK